PTAKEGWVGRSFIDQGTVGGRVDNGAILLTGMAFEPALGIAGLWIEPRPTEGIDGVERMAGQGIDRLLVQKVQNGRRLHQIAGHLIANITEQHGAAPRRLLAEAYARVQVQVDAVSNHV